ADVKAGTLWGSRFVTSPARARISVPPFLGPLALADGLCAVVAGAHADTTVAMMRIAAPVMFERRNIATLPAWCQVAQYHRGPLHRGQPSRRCVHEDLLGPAQA